MRGYPPKQCYHCGELFAKSSLRKQHLLEVHGLKPRGEHRRNYVQETEQVTEEEGQTYAARSTTPGT
jgi:hypothetical protein